MVEEKGADFFSSALFAGESVNLSAKRSSHLLLTRDDGDPMPNCKKATLA